MLAPLRKPLVSGAKQTLRAILRQQAERVFLAADAHPSVVAPVEAAAQEASLEIVRVPAMHLLGKACGLEVDCACAAELRSLVSKDA